MRRASKILTLILVVVFLFGVFAGCDLVGKDVGRYRNATAFTVGQNQTITVGKLLDTFNSYYNSYYVYVYYGNLTVDDIFDMAVESLYTQYMKVEKYTSDSSNVKLATNKGLFANAEYLEEYQLQYTVSYVKYLFFISFDDSVMDKINAKYELKDEETEDTSRDFYEYDELELSEGEKYADYYFNQNFKNEDMDEYIEKYYNEDNSGFVNWNKLTADDLQALYLEGAQAKVDELNERLDKDDDDETEITVKEYKEYQTAVISQYKSTVKNNYGMDLDTFMKTQVEDMIVGAIVNLYNYQVYKDIEGDNHEETIKLLQDNYDTLVAAQKTEFAIQDNFNKFITGLSDSSFIYDVPRDRGEDYVFVKNILIPFNAAQTAKLNSLKSDIGSSDDQRYIDLRNKLAAQIVADDFNTEKDDDGEYGKLEEKPFVVDSEGNVTINPECAALHDYLQDGDVIGEDKDQVIHDLMARFNTDTAQHSSYYSYVVYVGDDENYTHQWVQEFVDATKAAMDKGIGHYGIAVSDYGVHIVYVEGYVTPDEVNLKGDNYLDTTTTEYRLFKNYFTNQVNLLLNKDLEGLVEEYKSTVKTAPIFDKFLKENGLSYDLIAKLSDDED
ncbi:MAG: hypothetical protein J1F66_03060 [Clostridiales bacterium]|nr:hypothetical protein [Clostridiales bacterium]